LEVTINMPAGHDSIGVTGSGERNLKIIREALGVSVSSRDGVIRVRGDEPELGIARRVLDELLRRAKAGQPVSREEMLGLVSAEAGRTRQAGGPRGRLGRAASGLRQRAADRAQDGKPAVLLWTPSQGTT
jgi:phosphate starvation-inducible protein PhoH